MATLSVWLTRLTRPELQLVPHCGGGGVSRALNQSVASSKFMRVVRRPCLHPTSFERAASPPDLDNVFNPQSDKLSSLCIR
jgi:hypothetical protein